LNPHPCADTRSEQPLFLRSVFCRKTTMKQPNGVIIDSRFKGFKEFLRTRDRRCDDKHCFTLLVSAYNAVQDDACREVTFHDMKRMARKLFQSLIVSVDFQRDSTKAFSPHSF